jgi:hypothetical protein
VGNADCVSVILGAAARVIDAHGDLEEVARLAQLLAARGLEVQRLAIAPLSLPWRDPLPPGYLRGATAPLQAIEIARAAFATGKADALLLEGNDLLRSSYAPDERKRLMRVFQGGRTHLEGYALLTQHFIDGMGISLTDFHALAQCLFENYRRTCRVRSPPCAEPQPRWFDFVNEYFRGVDCANPYIDFSGAVLLLSERAAQVCEIAPENRIHVLACDLREAGSDAIEDIPAVSSYAHLETAYTAACRQAGVDFSERFLAGDALLEVYSCYPVVPVAFLLRSGLASDLEAVQELLRRHDVTVTGGLNLGRAPWNNTTLNAIITMSELLRNPGVKRLAGVHSNSSLGYQQGFLLLGRDQVSV